MFVIRIESDNEGGPFQHMGVDDAPEHWEDVLGGDEFFSMARHTLNLEEDQVDEVFDLVSLEPVSFILDRNVHGCRSFESLMRWFGSLDPIKWGVETNGFGTAIFPYYVTIYWVDGQVAVFDSPRGDVAEQVIFNQARAEKVFSRRVENISEYDLKMEWERTIVTKNAHLERRKGKTYLCPIGRFRVQIYHHISEATKWQEGVESVWSNQSKIS